MDRTAFVKSFMKRPRKVLKERIVIPTEDCPLPDFDKDLNMAEWVMLCHLVHKIK